MATILDEYRKLRKIDGEFHFWDLFGKSKRYLNQNRKLGRMVWAHQGQDELYELIFSGQARDTKELEGLFYLGVSQDGFMARIRTRQDELPETIQRTLQWYWEVYGK